MGQIKSKIRLFLSTFKITKRDRDSMRLIKWNVRFLLFCLVVYLIMTFYEWYRLGHPDLTEFRQFVVVVGSLTTAFTLLSKWLVDDNKDGVPDAATEKRPPNVIFPPPPVVKKEETKK